MALMHVDFFSNALGMCVNMDVIIPQECYTLIGMPTKREKTFKTLYLLHGLSDDHTIWQRRTPIERYVANKNIAVVMPNVHRSWYTNTLYGQNYFDFVSEELPKLCQSFFNGMSAKREDNYIAGLSMGGYGAMKVGLTKPENFAGIISLSGVLDIYSSVKNARGEYRNELDMVFGDAEKIPGSCNDIFYLAEKAASENKTLPDIYMWCGLDDDLLPQSQKASQHLTNLGYNVNYTETPGDHCWEYWDEQILKAIRFLIK